MPPLKTFFFGIIQRLLSYLLIAQQLMLLLVCVGVTCCSHEKVMATQLHCVDGKGAVLPVNPFKVEELHSGALTFYLK